MLESETDLGLLQHPLTIITKSPTLNVAAVLDPSLLALIAVMNDK